MDFFMIADGSRTERAVLVLGGMGASVFQGALSTFIGVFPLVLFGLEIYRLFFWMLFGIIIYGVSSLGRYSLDSLRCFSLSLSVFDLSDVVSLSLCCVLYRNGSRSAVSSCDAESHRSLPNQRDHHSEER